MINSIDLVVAERDRMMIKLKEKERELEKIDQTIAIQHELEIVENGEPLL